MLKTWISRWGPAVAIMALIFLLSARASTSLPNFGIWDFMVKKGAHMLGYGLLAVSYWRALRLESPKRWLAWALALGYAITDEFHQRFVPGRHPSPLDVLLFDNLGAILGLALWTRLGKALRCPPHPTRADG